MIGWWSSAGYFHGVSSDLKSVSQITFTDTNRPFVIPVLKKTYQEIADDYRNTSTDNLQDFLNTLQDSIGPDWYLMFTYNDTYQFTLTQYPQIQAGIDILTTLLPGWNSFCPKLNNFRLNLSSDTLAKEYIYCIYIPNLKRVLISKAPFLYEVDKDGNLIPNDSTNYLINRSTIDSVSADGLYMISMEPPFTSYSDLLVPKKVGRLTIRDDGPNASGNRYILGFTDLVDMTAIFSSGTAVDFEGTKPPAPKPDNPYAPGGESAPGDTPPGTFDNTSNPIPDSTLPAISAANTGFTRIYNPTLAQVQDLARYLWTDETVIQTIWNHIKQYFEDPMQAIIGFNLVPVKVPDGGSKNFALMYIDTGVAMNTAANQFVDVDCGTLELKRFYGSALDQSPFTKVSCFLPYIGTVQLNCDEVMGTTLQVKYRVDIVSGSCVAKILVDGNVLYQYSGHCAINIPISSADFSSYVASAISVAKLAIGATVGGVAGALSAVPEAAPQTSQTETVERTTARNVETGRQVITGTKTTTVTETKSPKQTSTKASYSYLSPANIANTVGQVMSSKPVIQHSGSFSGNTGYLGIRRPFLIVERPNMCLPEQYQHFNGYPAMITMTLSDCKGFTRIQQVQLTGLSATNPEQAEIMGLLKSGVYL